MDSRVSFKDKFLVGILNINTFHPILLFQVFQNAVYLIFEQLKDRTCINPNVLESAYIFYFKGNPTQQQIQDHIPVSEWSEPLSGMRCAER